MIDTANWPEMAQKPFPGVSVPFGVTPDLDPGTIDPHQRMARQKKEVTEVNKTVMGC